LCDMGHVMSDMGDVMSDMGDVMSDEPGQCDRVGRESGNRTKCESERVPLVGQNDVSPQTRVVSDASSMTQAGRATTT